MSTQIAISTYGGCVSVHVDPPGLALLTPDDAREKAAELLAAANQVEDCDAEVSS